MFRKTLALLSLSLVLLGCEGDATAPDDSPADGESALAPHLAVQARLTLSPDIPGPPFYARTAPPPEPVFVVDGWAVFQFYRDPACVPADFNLLAFFDLPAAFDCALLVEGFTLTEDGAIVPKVVYSRGLGAVPFWLVPAGAVQSAIQDGVLTIGELAGLPGRLVGSASEFSEMQHASAPPAIGGGGHQNPMLSQSARGTLQDGRSFVYHLTELGATVKAIDLHFE